MSNRRSFLDNIDKQILNELQRDCRIPYGKLAEKLHVSLSTIHYRIKRLEEEQIIQGYHADVNLTSHSDEFLSAVLLSAKFHEDSVEKMKSLLVGMEEVWAVYFILGAQNFLILVKTQDNKSFMERVYSKIMKSNLVEKLETLVISHVIKEDQKKLCLDDETLHLDP
ncbi:putative HTH-type transcriptional regulator [Candidatus Lokiarchaeum ossiferum]|uniref:HTH-type transcriptional regulator n=1 Tax=Candidatus Lokiarchaeum ossiferum TaxID=2951803 RepID=A0ABY6HSH0_9ARCH|nr:putative HTH-type transcriptional regulator [Candidatus Lokiarchaeum sp. B-35]